MSSIANEVLVKTTEYFNSIEELEGITPPVMLVDFAIEKYVSVRNFPAYYTKDTIEEDIRKHIATVSMAVVDLYMKIGAEGETQHSEKNISRVYENAYISASIFSDVLPLVHVF